MPVVLTIDNKSTDHFSLRVDFDLDDLEKVGPCAKPGDPLVDAEGNGLIAFMFKQWCDHKASDWFIALAKAALRVELAEAATDLGGEVTGPDAQDEGELNA